MDYHDPEAMPFDANTPVLYDTADAPGLYETLKTNPDMGFALAEQVLRALEDTLKNGAPVERPGSRAFQKEFEPEPGLTFLSTAVSDNHGAFIVTGFSNVPKDSPYVYADNITLLMPGCHKEGRSHLTVSYTDPDSAELKQDVTTWLRPEDTKSYVTLSGFTPLTVTGFPHAERMEAYDQLLARVACSVESVLK